ncbi:MAG: HopJ type III effector protein [gamma proteobacterium symbiont of Taylorina sp.]|nr:HopJ type III effector protein [gamma proteobacterium symbiont of Taylorina sp.]
MQEFLQSLKQHSETIKFEETMAIIEDYYYFKQTAFINGDIKNNSDKNSGSCKLFAFAKLHGLNEQQTLACFGQYYRHDVLNNPDETDHKNIRNFMKTGWSGLKFEEQPLTLK